MSRREIAMADSWKIDGNCENCRRKNYCSKSCTLNKRMEERKLYSAVSKVLNEKLGLDKIYDAMEGR